MNRYNIFLLSLLILSSRPIIAGDEDPDDPTNVKTPDEASKILPSTEAPQVSTADKNSDKQKNSDYRNGRKRRRRSATSEHKKFFNQTKKENR